MNLTEQFTEQFGIEAIDHNGNYRFQYVGWLEEKIELLEEYKWKYEQLCK
jgi:hypothetical protein